MRDSIWFGGLTVGVSILALVAGLVVGRLTGWAQARAEFQRPCSVTCSVTFTEDGWLGRGGTADGGFDGRKR